MARLNQAKDLLIKTLSELEEAILDKINQSEDGDSQSKNLISEAWQNDIDNFKQQINALQKSLANLEMENQELQNLKSQSNFKARELVNQIKDDLSQIKKISSKT